MICYWLLTCCHGRHVQCVPIRCPFASPVNSVLHYYGIRTPAKIDIDLGQLGIGQRQRLAKGRSPAANVSVDIEKNLERIPCAYSR